MANNSHTKSNQNNNCQSAAMALRSATPFATEKSLREPSATTKQGDAPLLKTAAGAMADSGSSILRKRTSEQAAVHRGGASRNQHLSAASQDGAEVAQAASGTDFEEGQQLALNEDDDEIEEEDEYVSDSAQEMQSVSEQTFVCPHNGCEKTFSRKIRLNAHMHLHYGT